MKPVATIAIVALSLPTIGKRKKRVEAAIAALEQEGFRVIIGSSVFQRQSYRSSDIQTRVNDLMTFFADPSVDCILSTTGGFNSNELLEFLDYSILQKNPTWFVGYSDITAVNLALYTQASLPTVHGPLLVDYVDDPSALSRLFTLLNSRTLDFSMPSHIWEWNGAHKRPCPKMQCVSGKKSEAEGGVISGNLSTFVLLCGTPYVPDCANSILFLEYDTCETDGLASLQRMLWQIRQSGTFSQISGLVIGTLPTPTQKEETERWKLENILHEVTMGFDFPVIFDAPFGHLYPSWFLVNGMQIRISTVSGSIRFSQLP